MHLLPNNYKASLSNSLNNPLQLPSSTVPDLTEIVPLILLGFPFSFLKK